MADDWSRPVPDSPEDDGWLADAQPDLGPLREAAERGELADAVAGWRARPASGSGPMTRSRL